MRKITTVLCFLTISATGFAQLSSNKSGDLTSGETVIASVEKFGGSAETRPKFAVINVAKDTLVQINFKKDLAYDWMQFWFKGSSKPVEVNTSDIISGLNYRKNLGSFLAKSNLVAADGTVNAEGLIAFSTKYAENLTEKYAKANEFEKKILNTKFNFELSDNSIHINGQKVGYATVTDQAGILISNIRFFDKDNKELGVGERNSRGLVQMKMTDGKVVPAQILTGDTNGGGNKMTFMTTVLRELYRAGYYAN